MGGRLRIEGSSGIGRVNKFRPDVLIRSGWSTTWELHYDHNGTIGLIVLGTDLSSHLS